MNLENPTREDFASLLDESFAANNVIEGTVIKGTVVAIEKDLAVVDVGLKVEGRVPLKEFGAKAKDGHDDIKGTLACKVFRSSGNRDAN